MFVSWGVLQTETDPEAVVDVPVWRLSVRMINTVYVEGCCKYRSRRKRCASGSCVYMCVCAHQQDEWRQTTKCRHGGKKCSSVIRPGIGWLTAHFSIVDVSQTHHEPSLPALFVYPHLFLSGIQLSALVWLWTKIKMLGCKCRGVVRFQRALEKHFVHKQHVHVEVWVFRLHSFMNTCAACTVRGDCIPVKPPPQGPIYLLEHLPSSSQLFERTSLKHFLGLKWIVGTRDKQVGEENMFEQKKHFRKNPTSQTIGLHCTFDFNLQVLFLLTLGLKSAWGNPGESHLVMIKRL